MAELRDGGQPFADEPVTEHLARLGSVLAEIVVDARYGDNSFTACFVLAVLGQLPTLMSFRGA